MRIVKLFFQNYKNIGFSNTLKKAILKWLGIYKQQEQIDTLHYFLNECNSVTQIKETSDPELRIMQKCDTLLLAIFDKICQKHNLRYWIDYGTLLGAVRHNGFIPWDDDTDVSMPREDYEQIYDVLKLELEQFDFEIDCIGAHPMYRIGLGFNHKKTGIWMDIYPADFVRMDENPSSAFIQLTQKTIQYRDFFKKHSQSDEAVIKSRKQSIFDCTQAEKSDYLVHVLESTYGFKIHQTSDVIPLGKHTFDQFLFSVPNNIDAYLHTLYGNYMRFPKDGIAHHGSNGADKAPLSRWAALSGTNMEEVYLSLCNIYNSIVI